MCRKTNTLARKAPAPLRSQGAVTVPYGTAIKESRERRERRQIPAIKVMQKLLLAINHKDTEEQIKETLKNSFLCVGTATYKEAVIPLLKDSSVDVLVIRDTLQGTLPITQMIDEIRNEHPLTRIVFISRSRPKKDLFLATLVSYGIYDIINKDSVPIDEIVYCIMHPRNFHDVAMYFNGVVSEGRKEEQAADKDEESKPRGLFESLFRKSRATAAAAQPQFYDSGHQKPEINVENMRAAIREEERRKAQTDIDRLIQEAVDQATSKLKGLAEKKDAQIAELRGEVKRKTSQAEQDRQDANDARVEIEQLKKEIDIQRDARTASEAEHAKQLASLLKMEDPKWFQEQLQNKSFLILQLENALNTREQELQEASRKIEKLQETADQVGADNAERTAKELELDVARDELKKAKAEIAALHERIESMKRNGNYLDEEPETGGEGLQVHLSEQYLEPVNGQFHSIVFLGAKHGVGNTTMALNTAVSIAKKGYKVLLIELNSSYPLVNHFFEFVNVTSGIDTACDGIMSSNTNAVDKAIIEPYKLRPKKRELRNSYKRLPMGLHFMVYSNGFLVDGSRQIDQRAIKDMFYYLTVQLKYGYIIVDIQSDDEEMKELFLKSGFLADRLVMTMTQDTHSIVSAGRMFEDLAEGRSANLAGAATVILNRYQGNASMKKADIQKWLSLQAKNMVCVTDDPAIYYDSSSYGIPYACSKAKYAGEYAEIANMLVTG